MHMGHMENFSGSDWSKQANAHVQGLEGAKKNIEEYEKRKTELDTALTQSTLSLEQRGVLFAELKAVREKLREAQFTLENLKMAGGQNLKKAA